MVVLNKSAFCWLTEFYNSHQVSHFATVFIADASRESFYITCHVTSETHPLSASPSSFKFFAHEASGLVFCQERKTCDRLQKVEPQKKLSYHELPFEVELSDLHRNKSYSKRTVVNKGYPIKTGCTYHIEKTTVS